MGKAQYEERITSPHHASTGLASYWGSALYNGNASKVRITPQTDSPHIGEAHCERLQVLGLQMLHAADEQRALGAATLN